MYGLTRANKLAKDLLKLQQHLPKLACQLPFPFLVIMEVVFTLA